MMLGCPSTQLPGGTAISPVAAHSSIQQCLLVCDSYWTVAVGAKNAVNISPCAVIRDSLWE
jgi:hypothetical protein